MQFLNEYERDLWMEVLTTALMTGEAFPLAVDVADNAVGALRARMR